MPIGFNSASRNLFLLGSTGEQLVTNFFKTIDQSVNNDGRYLPDEIRYNVPDQKFLLAGSASDSTSKGFGWFEKRDQTGNAEWNIKIQATEAGVNTTLRALELDSNNNLIVVGKTGTIPWIAKYSNSGVLEWQSASNSNDVEYTGITSDTNGNYYVCGNTPKQGLFGQPATAQAFVEKFDSVGDIYAWGKKAIMLGRDVVLSKIAVNSQGEVVAVGYIEDDSSDKGYIIKINAVTGEILWDKTLSPDISGGNPICSDVYIDNKDQIYVTVSDGNFGYLLKYTAEGNIIWQKRSNQSSGVISFDQVKSDGETEQTIVMGTYNDGVDTQGVLSKYSKNGSLVWSRTIFSSFITFPSTVNNFEQPSLDADPSFYYFLYTDDGGSSFDGKPDRYTFGKVSTSGNGLGNFQYTEGTGETIDYKIFNIGDVIGRLSDGSVRQDSSDLITYPFSANKLLFDDFATQVANKKRQMDSADSFEYQNTNSSGTYPKISKDAIVYDSNLLLNYDFANRATYDGSGSIVNNLSSTSYPGTASDGSLFSSAGYYEFEGNQYIEHATNSFPLTGDVAATLECWIYYTTTFSGATTEAIFAYGDGPTTGDTIALGLFDDHRLGMFFNGGTNIGTLAGAMTSYKNTWCHVVGTKSPGSTGTPGGTQTISLYVNGVQLTLGTWASPITPNVTSRVIRLGRWTNESSPLYFNGRMAEARIYNRVLSAAEVSQNFNATRSKYGV